MQRNLQGLAIVALATTVLSLFLRVRPVVIVGRVALGLIGLYLALAVYFSVRAHIAHRLKPNVWVPLTFLTYHTAFGWGMICGVFRFLGRRGARRHHIPRIAARG